MRAISPPCSMAARRVMPTAAGQPDHRRARSQGDEDGGRCGHRLLLDRHGGDRRDDSSRSCARATTWSVSQFLFGNTVSQFNTLIAAHGADVTFVDATDVANVERRIDAGDRLIFVETIANPRTQVADLARIGELARQRGILYVVDNTMTSPRLFRPKTVHAGS
jgi:cystathionine beta-lyase/cystathionine gamma-synthase